MRWTRKLSRWLAASAAGLFSVSFLVALAADRGRTAGPGTTGGPLATPAPVVPLFARTEPASNLPVLVVQPDDTGTVHGWVAGARNFAGAAVKVTVGTASATVRVGDDNTFTWDGGKHATRTATFTLPVPGARPLVARVALPTRPTRTDRTVFFVTDRSAYRPGDTLRFVAFARTLTPAGEFTPVANADLTVSLTTATKHTRAAQLTLRTDAAGRATGSYTFTDADALDRYELDAKDCTGRAEVVLAEYRKAKVGLKLTGEVAGGRLRLTFAAKDYLDRTVKGVSATYTATVTRAAGSAKLTLDPSAFARPEQAPLSTDDLAALPADDRLLALSCGVSALTFIGAGSRPLATREGTVQFAAGGPGTAELDLNPEWFAPGHTVTVAGTLLDETGRENRASVIIDLGPSPKSGVKVVAQRELVAPGETIPVSVESVGIDPAAKPTTTLVVTRIDPDPAAVGAVQPGAKPGGGGARPSAATRPEQPVTPGPGTGWQVNPTIEAAKRTLVTALPVVNGKADVELKSPGAYHLVAITRLADGTAYRAETGVVVKEPAKLPGLVLNLDRREVEAGSRLRGVVHTRFAGARLLLTLRDAAGVRLARPLTADWRGVARFDEPLPPSLRYGCAVTVQYPESPTSVHADLRELFVVPTDRTIRVTTTLPETAGPGEEVRLEIDVNRKEEVDLIVSVYDEALLSVAGDLSRNIRDFYLTDTGGLTAGGRELAAARLGQVTIAELVERAATALRQQEPITRTPGMQFVLSQLVARARYGKLLPTDLPALVQLAGFEVYLAQPPLGADATKPVKVSPSARLADLLRQPFGPYPVSATVLGNVVLLAFANPGAPDVWAAHRAGNPPWHGGGGFWGFAYSRVPEVFGVSGIGGISGFQGWGISGFGGYPGGIGGISGFGGMGGFNGGISGIGGIGGIGGMGGFGGGLTGTPQPSNQFASPFFGNQGGGIVGGVGGGFPHPAVGGFQGSFSYPIPAGTTLPGLGLTTAPGVGTELIRRDFSDAAFWTADLRTHATGKATTRFRVPDSMTGWRVVVTAVSKHMHVGSAVTKFKTTRPLMVWPMLPRTFTEGDTAEVFALAVNLTDKEQVVRASLSAENGTVAGDAEKTVSVPPNGSVPVFWTYRAGKPGTTSLLFSATSPAGSDASLKRLPVAAVAVEERVTAAGIAGRGDMTFTLPPGFDPAAAKLTVTVAPTLAADVADTLPYLVEYPYGCVEQTMSRFLPAVKVAQMLNQLGLRTDAELERKLPKVVAAGIKRLVELQQPDGGWGWQGNGTTHEMMTPYALYGLIEAEKAGYRVPNDRAIQRGLARLRQFLDEMKPAWLAVKPEANLNGASGFHINDSLYILSILSNREAVPDDWWPRIADGVGSVRMSDYGHALALGMAVKAGKKELAGKLAAELRRRVKRSGDGAHWTTAGFSRWGDNPFEVTAAALQALVAHDPDDPLIPDVLHYFQVTKQGDRWVSTKDTAMILYALCDYLTATKAKGGYGEQSRAVAVAINGGVPTELKLDGPLSKSAALPAAGLKPGGNTLSVKAAAPGSLVRLVVTFTRGGVTDIPARDSGVRVARTVSVRQADGSWRALASGDAVPKGSHVKVSVTGTPTDGRQLTFTLVESPRPAGGEVLAEDDARPVNVPRGAHNLREDRDAKVCFHFESAGSVIGEYVFLAEFAGAFRLPPARVEPMYRPASGGHSDSFVLRVTEK